MAKGVSQSQLVHPHLKLNCPRDFNESYPKGRKCIIPKQIYYIQLKTCYHV